MHTYPDLLNMMADVLKIAKIEKNVVADMVKCIRLERRFTELCTTLFFRYGINFTVYINDNNYEGVTLNNGKRYNIQNGETQSIYLYKHADGTIYVIDATGKTREEMDSEIQIRFKKNNDSESDEDSKADANSKANTTSNADENSEATAAPKLDNDSEIISLKQQITNLEEDSATMLLVSLDLEKSYKKLLTQNKLLKQQNNELKQMVINNLNKKLESTFEKFNEINNKYPDYD